MTTKLCALWTKVRSLVSNADPAKLDDQLVQDLHQLWKSRNQSDLELRHEFGRRLNQRLTTADQSPQRYGAAIMKRLSDELGVSRTELHRMCKFARVFKTVAAFKAACPKATTWEQVKKELPNCDTANAESSRPTPKDPTLTFWKRKARSLSTVLTDFDKAPSGTKSEDVQPCLQKAEAVVEKLRKQLSTCATFPQSNPVVAPSAPEGNTQQEGSAPSAQ
jgi:hypothetical protein